jgi:zinc and cadmium transporter
MTSIYAYSLLSVVAVSFISLVGLFTLSLREEVLRKHLYILVSLAVGALMGDALIHLLPEAFEGIGNPLIVSTALIASILLFFVLEKALHWHHHQSEGAEGNEVPSIHPTGRMLLLSDGMHNFIDGLIIGASYFVSVEVGIATTIAVILHEIPQEIGDFGVLIHSGYSTGRALWLNFLSALSAVAGTVVALGIGGASETFTQWLIPFAAGGFLYIAMSDLVPELHKTKHPGHSTIQFLADLVGLGAMYALLFIE